MLDDRVARIAQHQSGVISRPQLRTAGLSPGGIAARLRARRLFPVVRGVYALSPHLDGWGRWFAAVLSVGGDPLTTSRALTAGDHDPTASVGPSRPRLVALSHWSALHLYGIIERPPNHVHVTIEGVGRRRRAGVRIHRARTIGADDLQVARGLPITTPARTILDAAYGASPGQIRRLIREAEYQGLLAVGAVADVVRRNPFHPGAPVVRRADPDTAEAHLRQTPIEDRMAAILDGLAIERPEAQLTILGRSGRRYRADFAWPGTRVIVETDGRSSHQRTMSFQSDRDRDADLAAAGWLTLRFTRLQLEQVDHVIETILATVRTRHTLAS